MKIEIDTNSISATQLKLEIAILLALLDVLEMDAMRENEKATRIEVSLDGKVKAARARVSDEEPTR